MDTTRQHARYVLIFGAAAAAVLLPVLTLNYLLGTRSLGSSELVMQASRWQQATHGVTYAPPLSDNRPFKSARLFDRLPEIDTLAFGSSTVMGITQGMFPPGSVFYNFAQTGNSLLTVIAEAESLQRRQIGIQWLVIPLDWSLGFIYQAGTPGHDEVGPPSADSQVRRTALRAVQQLQDALTLPRVRNLFGMLYDMVRSPAPAAAFRQLFLQDAGDDYRCADGTLAKDFDTIFRGTCTGFRYDGSATFGNLKPVPVRRVEALIASAVVPSSKYSVGLIATGGAPNPLLLERLAALARGLKRAGGDVVLFLPPLLPGMERAFLTAAQTAEPLRHTKRVLGAWARDHDLIIIDAGQSERFGCTAEEFVDEHHALPQCYARIFTRFWNVRGALIRPGLWSGD